MKACKNCSYIGEGDICPRCGGQMSKEWQGYLILLNHEKSLIAKKMNINSNGEYALKVR